MPLKVKCQPTARKGRASKLLSNPLTFLAQACPSLQGCGPQAEGFKSHIMSLYDAAMKPDLPDLHLRFERSSLLSRCPAASWDDARRSHSPAKELASYCRKMGNRVTFRIISSGPFTQESGEDVGSRLKAACAPFDHLVISRLCSPGRALVIASSFPRIWRMNVD